MLRGIWRVESTNMRDTNELPNYLRCRDDGDGGITVTGSHNISKKVAGPADETQYVRYALFQVALHESAYWEREYWKLAEQKK